MLSYFVIPAIALLTASLGGFLTSSSVNTWYATIAKPAWTPPGSFIGAVWTVLYILAAASALIVWNTFPRNDRFWWIIGLFLVNAALNVLWSYVFFGRHWIGTAIFEAVLLGLSVLALMLLTWTQSKTASLLLLPYLLWVSFATYLTYSVWALNK
ncbi:MAG: TspO/MBR family protein [Candidatus Peribacteraceae bacterium]